MKWIPGETNRCGHLRKEMHPTTSPRAAQNTHGVSARIKISASRYLSYRIIAPMQITLRINDIVSHGVNLVVRSIAELSARIDQESKYLDVL